MYFGKLYIQGVDFDGFMAFFKYFTSKFLPSCYNGYNYENRSRF